MNLRKLDDVAPLIGTMFGGIVIGVIARNGFLDWTGETLLAGLLGLMGGWLAYKAATDHRRATENRNAYIFTAKHQQDLVTAIELLESQTNFKLGRNPVTVPSLETNAIINKLNNVACFAEPLPPRITEELEGLCKALPRFEVEANRIIWTSKDNSGTTVQIEYPGSLALAFTDLQRTVDRLYAHLLLEEDIRR
tara:strand:- start:11751 stop:12332 length:582 start_codon:yes stop_codon:yes gene_type:complete